MEILKRLVAVAALAAIGCASAIAQEWPTKPVTMVVPFAAGGPLDVLARILQPYVSETLGQQVVVENVTGGGGVAGSLKVSQAPSDSHVVLFGSVGTHAVSPAMRRKPAYDAVNDFEPVILVADAPSVFATASTAVISSPRICARRRTWRAHSLRAFRPGCRRPYRGSGCRPSSRRCRRGA